MRNLVLSIHDPSFPSEPDEDTGRGSPYTRGAARFLAFARELGFTGIQLGPQGQTSESNASPYDATLFSRNVLNVPLAALTQPRNGATLLSAERLAALVSSRPSGAGPGERYRYAFRTSAPRSTRRGAPSSASGTRADVRPALRELALRFAAFKKEHHGWLLRDALFEALCVEHGQRDWRRWAGSGGGGARRAALRAEPG